MKTWEIKEAFGIDALQFSNGLIAFAARPGAYQGQSRLAQLS